MFYLFIYFNITYIVPNFDSRFCKSLEELQQNDIYSLL